MAIGIDQQIKPRVPTTGLRARRSYVTRPIGPTVAQAQTNLERENTLTRQPGAAGDTVTGSISGQSPVERISREGMIRGPRQDERVTRTQYVGGRPGAVRVSHGRHPTYKSRHKFTDLPPKPGIGKFSETVGPGSDSGIREIGSQGFGLEARRQADQYLADLRAIGQGGGRGFAAGGNVDTVPAWLQPNEFVIDRANTNIIKDAEGARLESALMALAGDIKSGRRPGDRPPGGRVNFAGGGSVTRDMQPGYELGGEVPKRKQVSSKTRDPSFWEMFGQTLGPEHGLLGFKLPTKARRVTDYYDASGRHLGESTDSKRPDIVSATQEGYDIDYEYQQGQERQRQREKAEQEASRSRQMQSLEQMREASQRRSGIAKERGADLQRKVGDIAAKSAQANTAQAARMALARTSIQPVESSLSTASQMQLRSSLQGGILRAQAEMQAQKMSLDAEIQEATDAINIAAQQLQISTNEEQREFHLQRQREAQERQQHLAQKTALLQMKMAKAQEPSFWEAAMPSLISGGMGLLGTLIAGPVGGMVGGLAGKALASDRAGWAGLSGNARHGYGGHYDAYGTQG